MKAASSDSNSALRPAWFEVPPVRASFVRQIAAKRRSSVDTRSGSEAAPRPVNETTELTIAIILRSRCATSPATSSRFCSAVCRSITSRTTAVKNLFPGEHVARQSGLNCELVPVSVLTQDLAADTYRMMCRRHRRDKAADFGAMLVMEARRDKYLDGRSQYLCRDVAEEFLGGPIEQDD